MPIAFITDAQKECYKRVARLMIELFGDAVEASVDAPEFTVGLGSALVDVSVTPWRDDAIVRSRALVVSRPRADNELYAFLLQESATFDFGGFGLTGEGDVIFQDALLGSGCDRRELHVSVHTVLHIADQYDDRIQQRWGGQRASDRSKHVRVVTPHYTGRDTADAGDETVRFDKDDADPRRRG